MIDLWQSLCNSLCLNKNLFCVLVIDMNFVGMLVIVV